MTPKIFSRYFNDVCAAMKDLTRGMSVNNIRQDPIHLVVHTSHQMVIHELIRDADRSFSGKKFLFHEKVVTASSAFISNNYTVQIFIIDDIGITSVRISELSEL